MGCKLGFFFFLGLICSGHAILLEPFPTGDENQVCELCDKYVSLAIHYLQDDDNQNALLEALHITCSQIPPPFKKQICKKLNLCQSLAASQLHQGNCEACRHTVSEVVTKLKDPQTKLKIIRLLLKECKSLNNYQDKCKMMVFEYGPLMLADLDKFLEKKDVCTILGVCPGPGTGRGYYVPALADS